MSLQSKLTALATLLGTDAKTLKVTIGALANLSTLNKSSLVDALNEVFALASTGGNSAVIDDTAGQGANKTWSIDKIITMQNALTQSLLGDTPQAAYDTLTEIGQYIAADGTATSGMLTAIANRVSVDAAQVFTNAQKLQARTNIGAFGADEIGNPDVDLVAIYNTAKA
jgi:hypothetical protein